jgi:hypothetical protein
MDGGHYNPFVSRLSYFATLLQESSTHDGSPNFYGFKSKR